MILTLCGSARFERHWHEANKQLGLSGHICFSLMTFPSIEGNKTWYTPTQKQTLDLAHLAKIESSHGVVMLNIDRYLGESSLRELEWARMRHKTVYWAFEDERRRQYELFARSLLFVVGNDQPTPYYSTEWCELNEAVRVGEGAR